MNVLIFRHPDPRVSELDSYEQLMINVPACASEGRAVVQGEMLYLRFVFEEVDEEEAREKVKLLALQGEQFIGMMKVHLEPVC